ncbi:hypothetical protein C8Q80DRAFT_407559 [Daedaleopsis nitida]|nr:hypothetical protein C8Q80DRAFT_407559 [Daedaleopsis nitida]
MMHSRVVRSFLAAAVLPVAVLSIDNVPHQLCHFGECYWDLDGGSRLSVSGSHTSISDITAASGWTILDCDSFENGQKIRLACHDPQKGCGHLYLNGAEHTVVRLPHECGTRPFGIVAREWDHEDQSIPQSKRSLLTRRDGSTPVVKGIRLTTNHSEIDPMRHGAVSFFVQAATSPDGAQALLPLASEAHLSGGPLLGRDLLTVINETNHFDTNNTSGPKPFNVKSDNVSLFNKTFPCPQTGVRPEFTGEVNVGVQGKINGTVDYAVLVAGTIVPPNVTHFSLFLGLDAAIDGTLTLDATLTGSITTGKRPIVPVTGIPGLAIEGILAIGPYVTVYAEADAILSSSIELDVDLSYGISGAQLFFPPTARPNGSFVPGDSGLKLSANPKVTTHGRLEAHLIPTVSIGINLLDGFAETAISLDLDTSAALDLDLSTSSAISASNSTDSNATATPAQWAGCVDVSTGFSVDAVADADLLEFISAGESLSLFGKTFDLYQRCWGSTANADRRRADLGVFRRSNDTMAPSSLSYFVEKVRSKYSRVNGCTGAGPGNTVPIVDQKVSGSAVKPH